MNQAASIIECFSEVEDPRVSYLVRHKLIDIIVIAICAVIAGAEGWTDVESFGRAKEKWLRKFLELPNGIPSHDTFGDLFILNSPGKRMNYPRQSREVSICSGSRIVPTRMVFRALRLGWQWRRLRRTPPAPAATPAPRVPAPSAPRMASSRTS